MKGRKFTQEHRDKISASQRESSQRRWSDPSYAERVLPKVLAGKQSGTERDLERLLNEAFPGEWKYVGDGTVIIGGKNPDFINTNGKKALIELFGTGWHKPGSEPLRQQHFAEYGFKCLIIWQKELKDPSQVIQKVRGL
ncbi:MAG: hypothetical protein PHE59_05435 [Patescibacteria group bacterium]|nr:hypothetical protein [Patescibacteria group bacterium]